MPPSAPSRRILVVEDSDFVHQIYRVAFRRLRGWVPTHVNNGAEALEVLDRVQPDLIIVDINMPVMDGLRFLDAMRTRSGGRKPLVHVLVASTEGRDDQIRDALRRGASSYLKKPFTLDEFLQLFERIAATLPPPVPAASVGGMRT
jgi:two-component system chemotaxis response regulator CheY